MQSDLGIHMAIDDAQNVWRYMSFSRFLWLLQNKQLWLSRADLLGDRWEITLAGNQLEHMIARHPIPKLPLTGKPESAMERAKRIIAVWRKNTFVSCWSASEHESHALWSIYCGSPEGVAIQTTFGRLRQSTGDLPVYPVSYETPGNSRRTATLVDLITKKRPMFAYEHEVRIVRHHRQEREHSEELGYRLEWNPEKNIEQIRIHPEADNSFFETVSAAVEDYTPALSGRLALSSMKESPPT